MNIRFGTKLLSLKLTVQFIIFGLLVSYFSLILSVYSAGKQIFEVFTRQLVDRTMEIHENGEGSSWIEDMFVTYPEKGWALLEDAREIKPFQELADVSFTLLRDSGDGWERIFIDGSSGEDVERKPDREWIAMIDKARLEGSHIHQPLYLGQEGRRTYFVNITPPGSNADYVAAVEITHFNIIRMIRGEWERLWPTTLSVIFFSLVLGQLFTRPLSRSVRTMTDKALAVSRGDENVSFANRRLDDVGILSRSMDRMTHSLRHRARTLKTMNRIDRAVLSSLSRQELLIQVAGYIADQFPDSGVAVLERGEEEFHILALLPAGSGFRGTHLKYSEIDYASLTKPADAGGVELPAQEGLRVLFGEKGLHRKTVVYPLVVEENAVGSILITRDSLTAEDRDSLRMLADQGSVALKSLADFKAREKIYEGLLLSLTKTVDAKSRWTRGHSGRVTDLAVRLGKKAEVDCSVQKMIRIAGLLHDIGKLAIPEAILDKPGRLDDEEYRLIKEHPVRGYEILQDIPGFDGVLQAVRGHHERWDGGGYPDGLSGEDIPLIARIIMICDVYDAIKEDRPYRKGFSRENARAFMLRERGSMFDPKLLDAFVGLLEEGEG